MMLRRCRLQHEDITGAGRAEYRPQTGSSGKMPEPAQMDVTRGIARHGARIALHLAKGCDDQAETIQAGGRIMAARPERRIEEAERSIGEPLCVLLSLIHI